MPIIREGQSRRSWRREVAQLLLGRVDTDERVLFVSDHPEARYEMLKVAQLLPGDIIAEIYADPIDPHRTYLELRLAPAPIELDAGFRVVHSPNQAVGE